LRRLAALGWSGVVGEAKVTLCLGPYSEAVYESLLAEVRQPAPRKADVSVELEGGCVKLYIRAGDVNQLRVVLNSYLYLVHAAYSTLKTYPT
jgi:tRNA threonylcarbamoyladenosine modification (KEOPS) complex  Pcc1 subunit